jgi:hypothetical protein
MSVTGKGAVIIDHCPDNVVSAVMTEFRFWSLFLRVRENQDVILYILR